MSEHKLTRRGLAGLGALTAGAFALDHYLRRLRHVGEDVSHRIDVRALAGAAGYPAEGPSATALTMSVFSDYACGVCRRSEPAWRAAVRDAADKGRPVRIVYRDWPVLGPASRRAAEVAFAAHRQGVHAAFHRALIRTGRLDEAGLEVAMAEAGGDWLRARNDLATQSKAIAALLARSARDAFQLGFRGTPSFLIGTIRLEGGASEAQFADAIGRAAA